MARHVRKGDMVKVIAGKDKGRTGRVLEVRPAENRVVVEGIQMRTRNLRRTQQNQQGGQIQKAMPIHISNVQPLADGEPTRVRFETREDGSKVRVAVKTGEQLGEPIRQARPAAS